MQEHLRLPGWHGAGNYICTRCATTKAVLSEVDNPPWRGQRWSHWDLLCMLHQTGSILSPMWKLSFFESSCVKLDWLHIMDKGVANFYVAGLLSWIVHAPEWGPNQELRLAAIFQRMQVYYTGGQVTDRLNTLKLSMITSGGTPELTASAAELRALIPFFKMLVDSWPAETMSEEQTLARLGMHALHEAYNCLASAREVDVAEGALEHQAFLFQRHLVALHALNPERWVLRPKLHSFLELALDRSLPSKTWLYRDESFGGDVARQAHRKGGPITAKAMSRSSLLKFCAREDFPRICRPA